MTTSSSHPSPGRPVRLGLDAPADSSVVALADDVSADTDPLAALALVRRHADAFPLPGHGSTLRLWEALATVAATSLTAARAVEPHLDARAILAEARDAGHEVADGDAGGATWGVFAAEGPGVRLEARDHGNAVRLHGTKPWCSLAGRLSHALVTAWDGPGRRLYAVRLGSERGVTVVPAAWHARGLPDVPSGPVTFDGTEATPVGEQGWYLERPGFAWGGMGVAAVWFGGAVGVARRLLRPGREPDQIAQQHLGAVDVALWAARSTLVTAAAEIDGGRASGPDGAALALRVRHVVAEAAEEVLRRVGHATGPAPLALEADHAARVADLTLYLRQEHAERDEAALGRLLLDTGDGSTW